MKADNSKTYHAAIYLRLSKEDGDVAEGSRQESNSISNQKDLIMDYVGRHPEIHVHSIRVDDGYSGVDFNRPNFQQMLQDIKSGSIDCVIVKDLSRFGRNYIEAGRYIEKIFPMMGVRFIAVTDGYDSIRRANGSEMLVPFKNLINDAYSRDISIKIRSNLEVKRKRGEYIGAFVAYGYQKSFENKNKIIVDEYAAGVVKDIFRMKLLGMSQQTIADILNNNGILSPLAYKNSIGIHLKTSFDMGSAPKWSYVSVTRILKNEIYMGVLVQGRQTTPNYKVKTRIVKPESQWIRIEGSHEAIIGERDFYLVQELLKLDTRCCPGERKVYPLAGVLVCGDCLDSMVRKTVPANGRQYVYYVCSSNKKNKNKCSPHRISESDLMEAVLRSVQIHVKEMLGIKNAVKMLDELQWKQAGIEKYEERIKSEKQKKAKIEARKLNLYEDFKEGILSKKEYVQIKEEYSCQAAISERAVNSYEHELELLKNNKGSRQEWIKAFKKFENITELDRAVVIALIKQVRVYDKNRIEVIFNFQEETYVNPTFQNDAEGMVV
ncbi:MAG: recombinase family protein [Lachnospiraceae bacterium]|nr:recombinase family protein [Lachnospiraceae bacterium]MDE6253969.1 recombinase family protein [Lachnospiraceae bacterium]